jgi:hypothetical protein
VNPEKTNYMLEPRSQKIGQKHSMKTVNRSFENVKKFQIFRNNANIKIACKKRLRAD